MTEAPRYFLNSRKHGVRAEIPKDDRDTLLGLAQVQFLEAASRIYHQDL